MERQRQYLRLAGLFLVVACAVVVGVAVSRSGTSAQVEQCGRVTVYVDDAPWGRLTGSVDHLPPELAASTLDGPVTVNGEFRDGVFFGPHGLEVGDLTVAYASPCLRDR